LDSLTFDLGSAITMLLSRDHIGNSILDQRPNHKMGFVERLRSGRLRRPGEALPWPEKHWYETIVNRWWSDDKKSLSAGSHVTILTFNYDRSLEFYLSIVVGERTKQDPDALAAKIEGADEVVITC